MPIYAKLPVQMDVRAVLHSRMDLGSAWFETL